MNKRNESLETLNEFLNMSIFSVDEVFKKFETDEAGNIYSIDGHKFYFNPGTREDKILLVAHADTVWDLRYKKFEDFDEKRLDLKLSSRYLVQDSKEYYSNGYFGIGADDRAGVAMVWLLKDSGNSILITDEEEIGALTSKAIMNNPEWNEIINSHKFILQFDMNGFKEFKCYGAGSDKFKSMIEKKTKYKMRPNFSYTDVAFLGEKICGANLSIGYYNEHSNDECLDISEWLQTFKTAEKLSEEKHQQYYVDREFGEKYSLENIESKKTGKEMQ